MFLALTQDTKLAQEIVKIQLSKKVVYEIAFKYFWLHKPVSNMTSEGKHTTARQCKLQIIKFYMTNALTVQYFWLHVPKNQSRLILDITLYIVHLHLQYNIFNNRTVFWKQSTTAG